MFRRGIIISMIALINFAIAAEVTLNPIQLTSIKQDGGSDYQVSNNHIGSEPLSVINRSIFQFNTGLIPV